MNQIETTITSLEVAEMLNVEHYKVLRKLEGDGKVKGIIKTLSDSKIGVADYFKESTYKDAQGKDRKCYNITKMGCDFLANKFTGEKGIIFTAKYVKRFHEMQAVIQQKPMSALELINLTQQACLEVNEKVEAVKTDLEEFKQDLPLLGCDMDKITTAVRRMGVECLGGKNTSAYKNTSIRGKVYNDIYEQLKRQFGITTYKSIKRNQIDDALMVINYYKLPIVLKNIITDMNNQISFA